MDSQVTQHREDLRFPRLLSGPVRMGLWVRGFLDRAFGRITIDRGYVYSPYCEKLAQEADLRLYAEWQEANGLLFEIRAPLEEAVRECQEAIRQMDDLAQRRAAKRDEAMLERPGDEAVDARCRLRRTKRRRALVEQEFAEQEVRLRKAHDDAAAAMGKLLVEYQDVRDAARMHERLVRIDFVARLSCYARGASRRRFFIDPSAISDRHLSNVLSAESDEYFGDVAAIAGEAARLTSIKSPNI